MFICFFTKPDSPIMDLGLPFRIKQNGANTIDLLRYTSTGQWILNVPDSSGEVYLSHRICLSASQPPNLSSSIPQLLESVLSTSIWRSSKVLGVHSGCIKHLLGQQERTGVIFFKVG